MKLKTLVILNQVTNLSDARYAAGMGVQMMGFNFNPESPYFVDPGKCKEITGWIAGVELVGEFDGDIFSYTPGYDFDYVQVSNPDFIETVKGLNKKVILQIDLDSMDEHSAGLLLSQQKENVDFFLLRKSSGNIDNTILNSWAKSYPIILGFGIEVETIEQVLNDFPVKGISLLGGDEKVVGFKDYDQLSAILEALVAEE